jgi:hypothetical protein
MIDSIERPAMLRWRSALDLLRSRFGIALVAAFATCVMLLTPATRAVAQDVRQAEAGVVRSGALPSVAPVVFNGDVRQLPPARGPVNPHHWNENEGPPLTPQVAAPAAPSRRTVDEAPNLALAAMPSPMQSFAGLSFNDTIAGGRAGAGYPPDTNGDVGPNHYIQAVNDSYAIYSKTGTLLAAFTENALWLGANSGTPCDANNFGDPVVVYDALADRWILTNFAFANSSTGPFFQCFAVSRSGDPVTGGWFLYAVRMDAGGSGPASGTLNDYPKFGIWTDCLYMSANEFKGNTYTGSAFASFERSSLYAGATLDATNSSIGIVPFSNQSGGPFTMLPSNLLGTSTDSLPPAGRPNFYVSEALSGTDFEVRKFTPGRNGGHSCGAGGTMSAATLVPHATYSDLSGGDIVPQKNTANPLDSLYFRLMQKAQYRKIGNAESLWVVHSVRNTGQNVGPQWAQLNVGGGTIAASVVQQQLFRPDTTLYRWMGSLAIDGQGNMALAYSTSSGSSFPGIAYSGRLAGDPLNNLPQTETVLVAGADSQTNNCGSGACTRWGDYSSMSIDPSDDCTFWYTTEYFSAAGNGSAGNWNTRIGSFKFPACSNTKQQQTINFTSAAPVGAKFGGTPQVVTATATSGLAVTLTIDAGTASVCALNGSANGSQVSFIGVGTCKVNANQNGNGSFNAAAQVQQSFAVGKAIQAINFTSTAPVGAAVGDPDDTVTASATSGLAVTLSIDASSSTVCTIGGSASGSHVSLIGAGTCKINADQAGNANFSAAPQAHQSFSVAPGTPTLEFTTQPGDIVAGAVLGTIAVTEKGPLGDTIDDNASLVDFTVTACGGPVGLGSVTMVHGVATLNTTVRFSTATDPSTLQVTAKTLALTANSDSFVVHANAGLIFANGLEGCRP